MYSESPRSLGKYRLIAEIARGGMGIVYLAMIQGPGDFSKLLVVKELKPELVEEPAFLRMFLEEARLAARLNHSNIVQTNEVGNDGHRYFMAMDYLDGRGLERVRRRARHANIRIGLGMQLRVLIDVLAGLEYAHTFADFDGTPLGIVHRDVSPQNVFITFEGHVKLLDFGIAKTIDSINETRAGVLKGKLTYMAPEQARGERVDARADVFAVGVMMWEALTARPLRQGQTEQQIINALVGRVAAPRASTVNPELPTRLDEICAKALAPNRDDRYHSAAALQADLEQYMQAEMKPVTSRELGAFLRELFKEDRAQTNAMIETHVARARGGEPSADDLPIIDVSYSANDVRTPVSNESAISKERQVGTLDTPSTPSITAAPARPDAPPRSKAMIVLPVVLVGGLAAGALIYPKLRGAPATSEATAAATQPAPAPAPPLASTPPPPAPSQPARPQLIDVDVRVTPATASIEIDGASVTGNPFHGKYVEDGAMHQIRVTAPGYQSRLAAVPFDNAVALAIDLERTPVARPAQPTSHHHATPAPVPVAPAPEVKPTPQPPKSTDVDAKGGTKPHHEIDPNNPYGK